MNARLSRSGERLRFTALSVALMIIVSSIAMIGGMRKASHESVPDAAPSPQPYQIRPCEVKSIPTQLGTWIALDSSAPGTPAKAHVVVSDTTGMTIVADFHGFWRNTTTVNTTTYDSLDMPGASIMMEPGNPMLPRLSEHVEIPYDTDITIEVLATSNDTRGGYNIKPAPPPNVPMEVCELRYNTSTSTAVLGNYSSVYFQDSYFPGIRTNVDGRTKATSLIMRGHRLVKLRFFPVQYNPVSGNLIVFSQLVIRVKYNIPAQIEPVREALRSDAFERILMNSLLYYDSCHFQYSPPPGQPIVYAPWINTTTSQFQQAQIPQGYQRGAEYLIITTNIFKAQAQRLADWKLQKGILTKVEVVNSGSRAAVQSAIYNAYLTWYPAPTYVLLFGDVSQIPTNYEMKHEATVNGPFSLEPLFEDGYIGSDLGYFNIEGNSYFPDMIYGRISVDTVEQAEIIVNKTLQYEQTPPNNPQFYRNILSAGYFEDRNPRDGMEDAEFPFIYTLERIRHYLENEFYYTVHINYSCVGLGDHPMPRYFHALLTDDPSSIHVSNSLPEDYSWLWGYDDPLDYASARANITKNINAGRFLVLYYAHGGSKNMVYPYDKDLLPNGHDRNDRDFVEGWHSPYFNTSYFSDLMNGNNTPLVISIACNTGWFDGETDQTHMDLSAFDPNPFNDYENECFAENITRLATGGAVAAISASRPAYSRISADMLNGIVQAFWPGFLGSENQPIYEIGGALLFGKLYSAKLWMDRFTLQDVVRTTFEVFHLFGDPETQLWTDVPSRLSVTHPEFIGVSNPQKFVVTVRDERTHDPVDFAKVCIQQGSHIYQVGYTDTKGQIIFDCNPEDVSSYLNLTVTKHNYVPYINEIHSVEPDVTGAAGIAPQITLSHYSGTSNDEIAIGVSGFDDAYPVLVYFAGIYIATISAGEQSVMGHVPEGGTGYVNVWAYQGNTVAITRYYRLESSDNPDLYIYSQDESSTWHLADGVRVWDNPCITIFDGFSPTTNVQQHRTYDVKVTVYNKASASADDTDVTLFYASTGGGVSWTVVDTDTINIGPFGVGEATISWTPPLPNSACLKVEIEHVNERPEDTADNIGYECVDIIPLCSPGSSEFEVRNPTDTADYVLVKIRQEGDYDDVWKAAVVNYSSQALSPGESKTAAILIDPGVDIDLEDARLFTTEVFIGNDLIGGMIFDATVNTSECVTDRPCFCPIIILAMLVAGVILVIWYRKRSR